MNSGMLYYVSYMITEIITLYCILTFYNYFAKVKKLALWNYSITFMWAVLFYSLPNLIWGNLLINLFSAVSAFSFLIMLYEANIKYKIVLVIFGYLLGMLVEIVVVICTGILGHSEYYNSIGYLVLSRLLLFVLIKLVGIFFKRHRSDYYVSFYWWIVLMIPGASMYIVHQMTILGLDNLRSKEELPVLTIEIMLLIVNLLVFYLYDKLLQKSNEALIVESIRLQNKGLTEYMEREVLNFNKLKKWKHDNKNYLIGLKALLDNKNYQEVNNMLINEIGNIVEIDATNYSNNKILNSIFGYKLNEAQRKGITVQYDFNISEVLNMDYNDLAILLGNSMDNAVEACNYLRAREEKFINIIMRYERSMLFYQIENKYIELKTWRGSYITIKKEANEHGMGLKIINSICKKYRGVMNILAENNRFKLEIILFLD